MYIYIYTHIYIYTCKVFAHPCSRGFASGTMPLHNKIPFFVRTPKRKTLLTKNCSPLEYSTSNLLIKFLDITQIKCAILFSGLSDESCNMYVYSKSLSQYVFLHSLSFIYFLAKDHLFSF